MRRSTIRQGLVGVASLLLASCGGVLPGGGTGGTGMPSGNAGGPGRTGIGNFGGNNTGTGGLGGGPGMDCDSFSSASAKPIPTNVLIVLDASDAMNDDSSDTPCSGGCGASSKWAQTVAAIQKLVGDTETAVNWGLALVPDPGAACGVASGVSVPVGPVHAAAIGSVIRGRTIPNGGVLAGGGAPLRDAVNGATAYLSPLTDVGPKLILLVTAGSPSCLPGSSDPGAGDSAGATQAITNAREAGFATVVLGIAAAGGIAEMTLDEMAVAGGRPRTGSPRYTPVASIGELTAGVQTLLGIRPACTFAVPPSEWGPSRVGVRVDGIDLPHDPNHLNGWDYVDATQTSVEIYGPSCDALTSDPPHTVMIYFHCGPIP